jgi:hypothetical protein
MSRPASAGIRTSASWRGGYPDTGLSFPGMIDVGVDARIDADRMLTFHRDL